MVIDYGGTVRYVSGSVSLFGWQADEVAGRNITDFLDDDQFDLAAAAIAEFGAGADTAHSVPIVFRLRHPDGARSWVEVGGSPLVDPSGTELIILRLRLWDADHHLAEFVAALTEAVSLDVVLAPLTRSIAASLEGIGAAVHHGFDGSAFAGSVASWGASPAPPLGWGPWVKVAGDGDGELQCLGSDDLPEGPPGAASCWLVPLEGTDVVRPAVLTVWRDRPGPPLLGHRTALRRATSLVDLALLRSADHQRLQHLAGHDPLTGLANRSTFRDLLTTALESGQANIAVAYFDLDRFKPVNDGHGHRSGDGVLVEVATRLVSRLRRGDELARMGGDEFTVLMHDVPDATVAGEVADRLMLAIEEPFPVPGGEVVIGMSVGVALAGPGMTADDLISSADAALYACKRAGGGRRAVVG